METIYSKGRAFQLLDSFEQDLRFAIDAHLLDHLEPETVFGAEVSSIEGRRSADETGEIQSSLSHYLYLRQAYDTLLRNASAIPRDLGDELSRNLAGLDALVGVRNRVMHGRPLRVGDFDTTYSYLGLFRSRYFGLTRDVLARLDADRNWEPSFQSIPAPNERVLHNLPAADYEETGLIGRASDVHSVAELLLRGRDRMITITGEGGIGKTALALQIAYQFVDAVDPAFEAVLWVSLKNEVLTAAGVRSISDALRDVTGATQALGKVLDPTFSGTVTELAEYLSGLKCLVVIDNLESVQGAEVLELYDALPESVSFLFTSRVGIGEVERRYPLKGLAVDDAALLFRKFASRRRQPQLAGQDQASLHTTLVRLRHSPLAIRWFILSVESGRVPSDVLRNQAELLRFCVDNVYEALTADARLILAILRSLDRPVSFDELAVVSELPIDTLRRAAQDLAQGSLLVRTPSHDPGDGDVLDVSPTARAYLPRADHDSKLMQGVLAREAAYAHDREEHRHAEGNRQMDANVIRLRSRDDEPTAHLLRLALKLGSSGDYEDADKYLARARSLNPGFFEVDRVEAFLASTRGQSALATARYRSAMSDADSEEHRAAVAHFYAGHLARVVRDVPAAIELETTAHTVLPNTDTLLALGTFYTWEGEFATGQDFLEQALETKSFKLRRIVVTALVDSWRRWAEAEAENHLPRAAFEKSFNGYHCGKPSLETGSQDMRLADAVLRTVTQASRSMVKMFDRSEAEILRLESAIKYIGARRTLYRSARSWLRFEEASQSLIRNETDLRLSEAAASAVGVSRPLTPPVGGDFVRRGTIANVRDTYGFISHPEYVENIFFHFSSLAGTSSTDLSIGKAVEFSIAAEVDGRLRASRVELAR